MSTTDEDENSQDLVTLEDGDAALIIKASGDIQCVMPEEESEDDEGIQPGALVEVLLWLLSEEGEFRKVLRAYQRSMEAPEDKLMN